MVSHILLQETSTSAIPNIMRERRRLLAPGGITAHAEIGFFQGLGPYDAFIIDWDTFNNNEPFWGTLRDMDPVALMRSAGFAAEKVFQARVARDPGGATVYSDNIKDSSSRNSWFVIGARK